MDTQEYIASGIIERFALGQASCYEAMELSRYAELYPEIRLAVDQAIESVEKLAIAASVAPQSSLRDRVLQAVSEEAGRPDFRAAKVPGSAFPEPSAPGIHRNAGASDSGSGTRRTRTLQFALAIAAMIALIAGIGVAIQWQQNSTLAKERLALKEQLDQLNSETTTLQQQLTLSAEQIALLRDTATRRIALLAVNGIGPSRVDIYWNPERKVAYFDVLNLPQTPSGKQYQLWAIVDGAPVSMGVLPLDQSLSNLELFPFVQAPQAFAITLEKEGGSPTPSLDQMIVFGAAST